MTTLSADHAKPLIPLYLIDQKPKSIYQIRRVAMVQSSTTCHISLLLHFVALNIVLRYSMLVHHLPMAPRLEVTSLERSALNIGNGLVAR